jgi:hypothetical protein
VSPPPSFGSGGRSTLAGERGGGRVPIPTREHALVVLFIYVYFVYPYMHFYAVSCTVPSPVGDSRISRTWVARPCQSSALSGHMTFSLLPPTSRIFRFQPENFHSRPSRTLQQGAPCKLLNITKSVHSQIERVACMYSIPICSLKPNS